MAEIRHSGKLQRTTGSCGADAVGQARAAQDEWSHRPIEERLAVIRRFRHRLASDPDALIDAIGAHYGRMPAETLTSEIIPLADACKFLERRVPSLLATRRLGRRGRPAWLAGAELEIQRMPMGLILVLAPGNYPLFLPGVQILQGLAAGNAVLVKPAPACSAPLVLMRQMLMEAGLPPGVLQVLKEAVSEAQAAIAQGVDKLILTGSARTGRAVLGSLADTLTPAVLELSGNDPVFVLPGADLALTAQALSYGMSLNGGATCIAPRRVFVTDDNARALEDLLRRHVENHSAVPIPSAQMARVCAAIDEARSTGGRVIGTPPVPHAETMTPVVVADVSPDSALFREDIFAPVFALVTVDDIDAAIELNKRCPYVLGASIFGPPGAARAVAERITAGSVVINDVIVPTADPRMPFGGSGESGYGVTRGGEGLLEMTRIRAVSLRHGRFRPHYDPSQPSDRILFSAYLGAAHGAVLRGRLSSAWAVLKLLLSRGTRSS